MCHIPTHNSWKSQTKQYQGRIVSKGNQWNRSSASMYRPFPRHTGRDTKLIHWTSIHTTVMPLVLPVSYEIWVLVREGDLLLHSFRVHLFADCIDGGLQKERHRQEALLQRWEGTDTRSTSWIHQDYLSLTQTGESWNDTVVWYQYKNLNGDKQNNRSEICCFFVGIFAAI